MTVETFINQLASGQAADAKETLADLLSASAFEALDARKQAISSNLYGTGNANDESDTEDE